MRFKRILSLVLAMVFIACTFTAWAVTPVSAVGKVTPKRTIAIVYDNSGSMFMNKGKAWCQALYAIEVFASMMNRGDKLMVYPMNPMGLVGQEAIYTRDNPLIIEYDSPKDIIHNLKSNHLIDGDGTPIESIDSAHDGLKEEKAEEKWLVVLTDGAKFHEYINGEWIEHSEADTKIALENRFSQYIYDSHILYLGIKVDRKPAKPEINENSSYSYTAREADNSEAVPLILTEMCNMIFGRDTLPKNHMSGSSIDFDIPLSKLYAFIQGDGIGSVTLMKDGKEIKPSRTFAPTYSTAGCDTNYPNSVGTYQPDTTLKGFIAEYTDLESGTYTYSHSGTARSVAFYYEVDADLVLTFKNSDGTVITNADQVTPGDYTLDYALVDKDGNVLDSDLLGKVDFELQYAVNGENKVKNSNDSGQMQIHMDEETEFVLTSADVDFLSGYTIHKDGTDFGFLGIPFKGIKGAAKSFELKLSGGAKETDANLVSDVPPYIATLTYDGKQLTGSELDAVQFSAQISGSGIKLDVKQVDEGFEIKLANEDGLKVVPTGEYTIDVTALISSDKVADSSDSKSVKLRVKEVSDRLDVELTYSSLIYSTVDAKNVPKIIANVKYNGGKLTPAQFGALKFTAEADGIDLIVTPLPDKSAYLITLNTDSDIEKGEYPISITATGVEGRDGEMLTATNGVEVRVQLLPQWLVLLLWFLAILLLAIIIWLWLRTPVLPKKIRITNISVRVGGREMNNLKASVIYPSKGKKRDIKIKGTGDLSDARWSATLIPAKDSYRYLPSKKRKAMVVNGSVKASGYVAKIDIGAESYSRNKKDNKLFRVSESEKNFTFPKGSINYSGVKDINGKPTKYSVAGDIKFE